MSGAGPAQRGELRAPEVGDCRSDHGDLLKPRVATGREQLGVFPDETGVQLAPNEGGMVHHLAVEIERSHEAVDAHLVQRAGHPRDGVG